MGVSIAFVTIEKVKDPPDHVSWLGADHSQIEIERKRAGLTMRELGELLGLDELEIAGIERGRRAFALEGAIERAIERIRGGVR